MQPANERESVLVLQIVFEYGIRDLDFPKAQMIVEDAHDPVFPKEGGIEFDEGVKSLFQEELGDGLDFVRRAAMHCGEGHAFRNFRGNFQVREFGGLAPQDLANFPQGLGSIGKLGQKTLDGRALDALQGCTPRSC